MGGAKGNEDCHLLTKHKYSCMYTAWCFLTLFFFFPPSNKTGIQSVTPKVYQTQRCIGDKSLAHSWNILQAWKSPNVVQIKEHSPVYLWCFILSSCHLVTSLIAFPYPQYVKVVLWPVWSHDQSGVSLVWSKHLHNTYWLFSIQVEEKSIAFSWHPLSQHWFFSFISFHKIKVNAKSKNNINYH